MLVVVGCGAGDPPPSPRLVSLEQDLAAGEVLRIGSVDGPDAFGRVRAARLTPDGTRILILDRDPPFLKVFRWDGTLLAAYVEAGGGPAEMRSAAGLATTDQHAFLVGVNTLTVVDLEGHSVVRYDPGFQLVDVGVDCDDRVVGYGPIGGPRPHYLHSLRVQQAFSVVSSTMAAEPPRQLGWGYGRSGIIRAPGGSVVSHRRDGAVIPVYYGCDGVIADRPWSWALSELPAFPSTTSTGRRAGGTAGSSWNPTAPLNQGAAELPGGKLLWLESRVVPPAGPAALLDVLVRLEWFLADSAGLHRGVTFGDYILQDVAEGMVLLSAHEPWPHVVAISVEQLERRLVTGVWKARRSGR